MVDPKSDLPRSVAEHVVKSAGELGRWEHRQRRWSDTVRGAGADAVDKRVFGARVNVHALLEVDTTDLNEDRLAVGQVAAGCGDAEIIDHHADRSGTL